MSGRYSIDVPRDGTAPTVARMAVGEWFGDHLDPGMLATAKLLTSELVTNAYVHGAGQIRLEAELDGDRVRVAVIDDGGGFEHQMREAGMEKLGGWGLSIVDQEASRWGLHEGTTHVWFELERPGPRLGHRAVPSD